jgi:gamma-glutamyl-gamma-aminobutyrate hydrolase PuuD
MKVYIVGGEKQFINFLPELEVTDNLKEAKIVVFTDGPIVSPSLYKEKKDPNVDLKCDINRDRADKSIYTKMKPDQIAVGIGRGACFLSVMNGAKLIQYTIKKDIDKSYDVEVRLNDKPFVFSAISDWIQAINLTGCTDYNLIGRSKNTEDYITDNETKRFMRFNGDPELVEFHKPKMPVSYCVQFHPEWMPESNLSKLLKTIIYERANS